MGTVTLDSRGYDFDLEIDGEDRIFNVGVVYRSPSTPTSVHFNEQTPNRRNRTTFGLHLPRDLWSPMSSLEFESLCRKAITCAIQGGLFALDGHHDVYAFDNSVVPWEGNLRRTA